MTEPRWNGIKDPHDPEFQFIPVSPLDIAAYQRGGRTYDASRRSDHPLAGKPTARVCSWCGRDRSLNHTTEPPAGAQESPYYRHCSKCDEPEAGPHPLDELDAA